MESSPCCDFISIQSKVIRAQIHLSEAISLITANMLLATNSWLLAAQILWQAIPITASSNDGLFQLDFTLEQSSSLKHVSKRDTPLGVPSNAIDNFHSITVNASVGTPGQPLRLWVLTGSADLEILSSTNPECIPSCKYGTFNPNASSTHVTNYSSVYNISYSDGTSAVGVYMTDQVVIGGTTVSNLQFGLNQNSSSDGYPGE